MIKKVIKYFLPKKAILVLSNTRNSFPFNFSIKSYSQEGEDMILRRIFERIDCGFYVDIGAHHPFRFSNTYHFYKKGWRGINIDAMPGSMGTFKKHRPFDINIETPVGKDESNLIYYSFNEPALNGFSEKLSLERDGVNGFYIKEKIILKTRKLSDILDQYLPANTKIDFINIDAEGFDLDILKSNDWVKYSPKAILVEVISDNFSDIYKSDTSIYLNSLGYKLFAKSINTVIFVANDDSFRFI